MLMNKIRLIALDIDGTLMQHDGVIPDENKEAVRQCLKNDIAVYLVTGRPYSFARMIADRIDQDVRVVAANGGIYECGDACIEQPIDQASLTFLITQADNYDISLFLKGKHALLCKCALCMFVFFMMSKTSISVKICKHASFTDLSSQQLNEQAHDILKILTFHEDPSVMKQYRQLVEGSDLVTVTDYRPISFDITAKGVDKGSAPAVRYARIFTSIKMKSLPAEMPITIRQCLHLPDGVWQ